MPEGPEVYTFGLELFDYFQNNILTKIKILSGKYKKKKFVGYNLLKKLLPSNILSVSTYGKILLLQLESDNYIIITFGMTGFITSNNIIHNHIEFVTKKSEQYNQRLFYNDQRNFGNIYVLSNDLLNKKIKDLGPDLLDDKTTFQIFKNRFNIYKKKYPDTEICLSLIDQSFICGIGNYLRSEILYYSKINPYRQLKSISNNDVKYIYENAYNLMRYYASIQININDFDHLKSFKIYKSDLKYDLKLTPKSVGRVFMIYEQTYDIHNNKVSKEKIKGRSIYWVKNIQI